MSKEQIPKGAQFFSDYFKRITGGMYFFRKQNEDYEVWAIDRWVPILEPDRFILNHIKSISDYDGI